MSGINVVVFLVRCTADLMVCETAPSEHLRFEAMETCRAEVSRHVSERNASDGDGVWMAKCLYRMASADPRRERRDRSYADARFLQMADIGR